MVTKTLDEHIEVTPGVTGGKPRIAGRRITVQDIAVWHEWMGTSVDQIATEHNLQISDVYAALAYYHDHREEIDKSIKESDEFIQSLRTQIPSKLSKKLHGD
jgi:uncharacterized protein (DUF433 family)